MTIGDRLRTVILEEMKSTASDVATRAGVSAGTLSRWMSGERENPGVQELAKVARVIGVTVDWLCDGGSPKARQATGDPELAEFSWPADVSEAVRIRAQQRLLQERDAHRRALVPYWHERLRRLVDDERKER